MSGALARIDAEEQLASTRASSLAFGGYGEEDAAEIQRQLRSIAAGEPQEEEAARPKRASAEELAAMGIGMVVVPPSAAASEPSQTGVSDG